MSPTILPRTLRSSRAVQAGYRGRRLRLSFSPQIKTCSVGVLRQLTNVAPPGLYVPYLAAVSGVPKRQMENHELFTGGLTKRGVRWRRRSRNNVVSGEVLPMCSLTKEASGLRNDPERCASTWCSPLSPCFTARRSNPTCLYRTPAPGLPVHLVLQRPVRLLDVRHFHLFTFPFAVNPPPSTRHCVGLDNTLIADSRMLGDSLRS